MSDLKRAPRAWAPLLLSASIAIVDQMSKAFVVRNIREGTIAFSALDDFLWIVHARNTGIVFSIGAGLPETLRRVLFMILPMTLMIGIGFYYLRGDRASKLQRWAIASIIGGGLGNLIDRVFRPEGVVDFISTKMYGILGMDRFPTWNVADASVVVGACLVALSIIIEGDGAADGAKKGQ